MSTDFDRELAEVMEGSPGEDKLDVPFKAIQVDSDLRKLAEGAQTPKVENDGSKPLKNLNHERFAALVVSGKPDYVAYMESYQCSRESAEDSAWKLRRDTGIVRRIEYLTAQITDSTIASMVEVQQFLTSAIRTPIAEIDGKSPLAQEIEYKEDGSVKIKSVSKLGAAEQLSKLSGWVQEQGRPIMGLQINLG